jgi:peptide/nickel transport system substrate-binding protein
VAAVAVILAACGGGGGVTTTGAGVATSATTQPSTATGGTVRIGWAGAVADLNPGLGVLAEDYSLYELVYDTPIGVDLDGNYVPELATDWSVADDGLTWTMTLVDNAVFHDGTPLTSADVKFTLELYRDTDEDFPFLPSYPDVFETIEAPDPTTVTITTPEPIGNFESRMVFMYVLPKHIWEAVDPVTFDNAAMVGSGSFVLAEQRQGEFTRLTANKDYWGGPPNVEEVILQTFENSDARVQALINGDVDMITEFPATAIAALRNEPDLKVVQGDPLAPSLRDIIFNMVDPASCPPDDGVCSGHPALRDLAVRQALAHAVDKQQLIDVLELGLATPGIALTPSGLGPFFNSGIVDYPFDIGTANRMLDEAGYLDTDGDGVRECPTEDCGPTGDLTLRLNYADDIDTAPRLAEFLKDWWGQAGVKVEIQGLDPDTLTSVCCPSFDFDVIIWGWGSDPDPGFLLSVVLCDEIPTGTSETGYCNPDYDELYFAQAAEVDPAKRLQIIHEMQAILHRDVPYIIPYYQQSFQAYRTDTFTGWQDGASRLALEDPSSLNVIRPAG